MPMRDRFRSADKDAAKDEEAMKLYTEARALLDRIVEEKLFRAWGAYGFFPGEFEWRRYRALRRTAGASKCIPCFTRLRQQMRKEGQTKLCAGGFRGAEEQFSGGLPGLFRRHGTGHGADDLAKDFEEEHDDYHAILAKALADRLAEAFAEYLHWKVREHWGYGRDEKFSKEELIREKYRGIRPAAGYPAQPDHTEKRILFDLLQAEKKAGVTLTESMAMHPGASVSGLYFSHPESRYFGVGMVGRDQVEDYAARKGMSVAEVERWLAPSLAYDPAKTGAAERA